MDPEFQRILFRVLAVGGAIGTIGAAALFVAFRAFRGDSPTRAPVLVGAVIAFVLVVCAALLMLSVR
jgi:CHASE2 domain-containing sensor protein